MYSTNNLSVLAPCSVIYPADVAFIACWQDLLHSQSCRLSDLACSHLSECNLLSGSQLHTLKTCCLQVITPPPALFHSLAFIFGPSSFVFLLCSKCHLSSLLFEPSPLYCESRFLRDDLRELAAFNCLPGSAYLV